MCIRIYVYMEYGSFYELEILFWSLHADILGLYRGFMIGLLQGFFDHPPHRQPPSVPFPTPGRDTKWERGVSLTRRSTGILKTTGQFLGIQIAQSR